MLAHCFIIGVTNVEPVPLILGWVPVPQPGDRTVSSPARRRLSLMFRTSGKRPARFFVVSGIVTDTEAFRPSQTVFVMLW
jgi:hypothetical protein